MSARGRERESSDWRPRERRENFVEKRENEFVREKERRGIYLIRGSV